MINNQSFIIECKKDKIVYKEYITIDNTNVEIKGKLYQTAYKDTTFFGKFNLSYIKFTTRNNIDYKKKDFNYYKVVNGESQKIGHFYVTEVKDSDTEEEVEVTAFDDGIKFANKYISTLDYTNATLFDVLQECCTKCGIPLKNTSITNGDFIVTDNQFVNNNVTYGDVICAVSQISGDFAFINYEGELELKFPTDTGEIVEQYVKLDDKRDTRPITIVRIGMSQVEGEYVERRDEDLIIEYGENYLIINDNPFMYTESRRNLVIDNLFNKVKGFGYSAFESKECFAPYFELGDGIRFRNKSGNLVSSAILRIETDYDNTTFSAPSITNAEVTYNQPQTDEERIAQTELSVDKARQQIQELITNTTDNTEKISSLTQTVNGFDARITQASTKADNASAQTAQLSMDVSSLRSEIGEVTDTTVHETGYGSLSFEDINQSYPVKTNIHPMADSDIAYLYPSTALFPSSTLYPKNRILRFTNTTTSEVWNYSIPDDLRYYNAEIYDEFNLDFGDGTNSVCQIVKRVGINADRTKYALVTPETTPYSFPLDLALTDGDYTVELLGYPNAYLDVTLMSKNMYTSQFATKVEMNSKITQKADEITTEVAQTYETIDNVNELSTRVTQTEDNITSEVTNRQNGDNALSSRITQNANNIELKVSNSNYNHATIVAKINDNTSSAKINADKVDIDANDVLNLLAGNTINMTSKNIAISSNNFNVDKNGNMSCSNANVNGTITSNNATITGGSVVLNGNAGSQLIKVQRNNSNSTMAYVAPDIMAINNNSDHVEIGCQSYPSVDVFRSGVSGTYISHTGIRTPTVTQTSKESTKKNIQKYEKTALDIVNNSDLYEYNYKFEKDTDKKHIGFIIGDEGGNYKTPDEVIAQSKEGIDNNTMTSIIWKAVQEQQEIIEQMKKEINKLKGES